MIKEGRSPPRTYSSDLFRKSKAEREQRHYQARAKERTSSAPGAECSGVLPLERTVFSVMYLIKRAYAGETHLRL